jgi:hypothetical protein
VKPKTPWTGGILSVTPFRYCIGILYTKLKLFPLAAEWCMCAFTITNCARSVEAACWKTEIHTPYIIHTSCRLSPVRSPSRQSWWKRVPKQLLCSDLQPFFHFSEMTLRVKIVKP